MVAHWAPSETMDRASSTSKSAEIQSVPQPMDVQNQAPPPFLNKTYDMVDDPSTDSIVSWNAGGNGFVVWNSNEFQKELLPKYFKHNNFSSFVRQLNTYGFRKVDPDRWEFANEGFLRGQKHLLRSIQRKKPMPHSQAPQAPQAHHHPKPACVEVGKFGLEGEIERLKRDKNVLMAELVRLRQHQQQTDRDLQMVLQRLHVTEQRQQQMISFLAKAMQSPSFLAQLVQQNENKKRLATTRKKRRLPKQDGAQTESVSEEGSPEGQIVKYQPNSSDPMAMFMQYMNSPSEVAPKVELPSFFKDNPSGLTLTEMHTAQMAADLSPARMMKDLSDSMAAPTSPLSLMRFESVEGLEGGDSVEQQRDGEGISSGEEMTNVDFEWDQFLAQVQEGGIFESVDGNTWLEENGQVEQLAEQMDQLTS